MKVELDSVLVFIKTCTHPTFTINYNRFCHIAKVNQYLKTTITLWFISKISL